MNPSQFRILEENINFAPEVLYATNSAAALLIDGPIDVYQIQIDNPANVAVSVQVHDGTAATLSYKATYMDIVGTREITFLGGKVRFTSGLYITRPQGDSDDLDITVIYKTP